MSDRKTQPPAQPASASIMARAHQAPRCSHIKQDGFRCQSPALRGKRLCYFHGRIHYPRPRRNQLPPLEDANSVQAVLLSVQRALLQGTVDHATARLLLYALEIASNNLKNVTFEPLSLPGLKPTRNPALYAGLKPRSSTEAAAEPEIAHESRPAGPAESSPGRESRESSEERGLFRSAEGSRAGLRPQRA